jgi:mono/diheme cytochrome c family protein
MKYGVPVLLAAMLTLASCTAPGRRAAEKRPVRPSEVLDFDKLYAQNCSGCHGADGQGGLTVGVGDPVYLAIADDATIRRATAEGVPETTMPGFSRKAGGFLTEEQIDVLVRGIRARWAKPGAFDHDKPPAYASAAPGDPARGQNVFLTFCSSCHGQDGRGGRSGSIVDNAYLGLVSNQHLRTVTITGMPALGAPDWRGNVPGRPLSDADVTDVVAWLAAHREPVSAQLRPPPLNAHGGPQ